MAWVSVHGVWRVCMVWDVCGVSVHAETKYMRRGVSVHGEGDVCSVGYMGSMRSGDECAHGGRCAQDVGGAQVYQNMCMGTGGA